METISSTESTISDFLTVTITFGVAVTTHSNEYTPNIINRFVESFQTSHTQIIGSLILSLIIAIPLWLLIWSICRLTFSIIRVRNRIYTIHHISSDVIQEKFGAFGGWEKQEVILMDKNNKRKQVYFYPEVIKGFSIGDQVALLKRQRQNTYEMNRFYLIPKQQFNVKQERINYILDKDTPEFSNASWRVKITENDT